MSRTNNIEAEVIEINSFSSEYRRLDGLNYSMIWMFYNNPIKFYKKFILGQPVKEAKSDAIALGSLIDYFLLECKGNEDDFHHNLDEQFCFIENKGSGQAFELADLLYEFTLYDMDAETKECKTDFKERFTKAFDSMQKKNKYKGKNVVQALDDFKNSDAGIYFDTCIRNIGKIPIDDSVISKALSLGNTLIFHEFTSHLFNNQNDGKTRHIIDKLVIQWEDKKYEKQCKAELDKVIIDDKKKLIYLYDLKCTYDNEGFEYSYIKNGYYIQQAWYKKALENWKVENDLSNYSVMPMQFIVADTSVNERMPLIYQLNDYHYQQGIDGFKWGSTYHPGVNELILEMKWAEENNIWTCNKDNYLKKGVIELRDYE